MTHLAWLDGRGYHAKAAAGLLIVGAIQNMLEHKISAVIFSMALAVSFVSTSKADVIATIGEYNGAPDFDFTVSDYPLPSVLIGDFTFSIPAGASVIGGTISGTFGNDDVSSSTAASDYFVDNGLIEVAECDDALIFTAACDTSSTPTAWSYTFTASDLANLSTEFSSGIVDFTVNQNFAIAVATGTTTLDLVLSPEPASVFVFCGGLAGIALLRRFRKP